MKYLDFLWRSSRRNVHWILLDFGQLKGRLHLRVDLFSFSLVFVGFWDEHGYRS